MRILIATSSRKIVGGIETYLQILIPALLKRQHQVALLYDYFSSPQESTVDPPQLDLRRWRCEDLLHNPDSWRELTRWGPDVVYSHGLESIEIEQDLAERYPAVLYTHTYRGTCISGQKCHTVPRANPCSRTFGPTCLALFYPRRCGGLNPLVALKAYGREMSFKALLTNYRAVLVASRHMRREMERNGVSPERLHLAPLPISVPDGPKKPMAKAAPEKLLFIGRLFGVKGARYLLEAIPRAAKKLGRPLTLTVAGDGPERRSLQDLARRLGLDAEFPGWVDPVERGRLMRQADLLGGPQFVARAIWTGGSGSRLFGIAGGGLRGGRNSRLAHFRRVRRTCAR